MRTDAEKYSSALKFAESMHAGQLRRGGLPYITHPIAVARILDEGGFNVDYRIAGLFHDLLEDTDATEAEIKSIAGDEVLRTVKLLTKTKGYVMAEYVAGIKADSMAFAVKCADRLHNLRCAVCTDDDFKRKYILETIDWYFDFSPEIVEATKALAKTLSVPMTELSLLYEPVESWKAVPTDK